MRRGGSYDSTLTFIFKLISTSFYPHIHHYLIVSCDINAPFAVVDVDPEGLSAIHGKGTVNSCSVEAVNPNSRTAIADVAADASGFDDYTSSCALKYCAKTPIKQAGLFEEQKMMFLR